MACCSTSLGLPHRTARYGAGRQVVALEIEPPAHEAIHWTVRALARAFGDAASSLVQIWHDHGLAPHRWRSFKLSNNRTFAEKLHYVVGLSLAAGSRDRPSGDERGQIQALDRTRLGLPLKRGRAR